MIQVRLTLLIGLLQLLCLTGWAQLSVQGSITDGADKKPIPFANVFLANTTIGTIAAEDGKFALKNVPSGKLDMIISCVGYEALKITIQTTDRKSYRIILKPAEGNLLNVTVKAKRGVKWKENLAFFETVFLGASDNASQCKIMNPEVLSFYDTLTVFKARANDLLLIENKGLGYRLKYALENFTYNYGEKRISYKGYPVFERLTPRDEKEESRWLTNQQKAFQGSIMHFMRSLHTCTLYENGFLVQRIIEKIDKSQRPRLLTVHGETIKFYPTPADSIIRIIQEDTLGCNQLTNPVLTTGTQSVLSFSGTMQVTYLNEYETFGYQRSYFPSQRLFVKTPQVSIVHLLDTQVTVEPEGHFYETDGIIYEGYWSWELIAEMLPVDYYPKN